MMMNLICGTIGIASLSVFLGILLWWIKEPPLIIISAIVMALLLIDFVQTLRDGST